MMTLLNRLRGTQGLWSKIIGLLLALIVQIAFDNPYVSVAVGLGYIIGESFGWGEWVGTLTSNSTDRQANEEGANNGIRWLASLVYNPLVDWRKYCTVALAIRGIYWWGLTLAPLYFVANTYIITLAIVLLSAAFPLACELGRLTSPLFSFEYKTFSIKGGSEHIEVWYGVMQDIVLIGVVLCLG